MNEICEEERRKASSRLSEREPDELAESVGRLRQQNVSGFIQIGDLKEAIFHILFLQTNSRAAQHDSLKGLGKLNRQAVTDETAVTDPDQAHSLDAVSLHHPHHARRLERLRPLLARRVGLAEEQEVRHEDVEPGREVTEVLAVLPHGVGSEAVDEDERRLCLFVVFGNPAVHDRALAEIYGARSETGVQERLPVYPVSGRREAEPFPIRYLPR